ncbi:MAG: hypothetical protein GY778_26340, partial [bacterium]|nr:hypothetical protein [bacterium]
YLSDGLLVTGANVETNEFLYGALASKEVGQGLVAEYEATLPAGQGDPSDWVNVPLVYVEASDVR